MNQEIVKATLALGELLMNSPEYEAMQQAEAAALNDEALQGEYREYAQMRTQLQELTMQDEPDQEQIITLQDDIERVQVQLQERDTMIALTDTRSKFDELMNDVNGLLADILSPEDEDEEDLGGCGSASGCAGCSGCGSGR